MRRHTILYASVHGGPSKHRVEHAVGWNAQAAHDPKTHLRMHSVSLGPRPLRRQIDRSKVQIKHRQRESDCDFPGPGGQTLRGRPGVVGGACPRALAPEDWLYIVLSRARIWAQGMGGSSGLPLLGSRKATWHTANVTLFSVPRKHLKEDGEVRRSIGEQAAAFLASVALPRATSHRPKLPNCIKFRCQAPLGWPTQNTGSASSCNYHSNSGRSALAKLIGICGQNRRRFQIWKCNPAKMATHGFA